LLQTSEATVVDGDVLGAITFNAPNEGSGTDALLVGAAIEAVAEGTFAADNNATELVFKTGASAAATTKMTITSAGRIGIGTLVPGVKFEVNGDGLQVRLDGTADTSRGIMLRNTGSAEGQIQTDGNMHFIQEDSGKYMRFSTANAERMRIESNGDLRFGLGSGGSSVGPKFYGGTLTTGQNGFVIFPEANGSSAVKLQSLVNNTGARIHFRFTNPNGTVGQITTSGSATTYATSSDYRLKTDAQPMTGASARVLALKPVNFEWISDGSRTDGFLAHEAQAVVPEAVTGTKDAMMDEEYQVSAATGDIYTPAAEAYVDADGNDVDAVNQTIHSANAEEPETFADGQQWRETTAAVMGTRSVPDMQGIDQSKLVPLLTAALQEALTEITALKTRVEALEAG